MTALFLAVSIQAQFYDWLQSLQTSILIAYTVLMYQIYKGYSCYVCWYMSVCLFGSGMVFERPTGKSSKVWSLAWHFFPDGPLSGA